MKKNEEKAVVIGKALFLNFDDFDFGDTKLFEDLLKAREDIFEIFCPNEKCVSLVRVSKKGSAFGYRDTPYGNMLIEYEVYHGDKIGILIRNGENLYFGWTDDEKIKLLEDMFLRLAVKLSLMKKMPTKSKQLPFTKQLVDILYFLFFKVHLKMVRCYHYPIILRQFLQNRHPIFFILLRMPGLQITNTVVSEILLKKQTVKFL